MQLQQRNTFSNLEGSCSDDSSIVARVFGTYQARFPCASVTQKHYLKLCRSSATSILHHSPSSAPAHTGKTEPVLDVGFSKMWPFFIRDHSESPAPFPSSTMATRAHQGGALLFLTAAVCILNLASAYKTYKSKLDLALRSTVVYIIDLALRSAL
jgi:hypothetical protein